MTFFTYFPSSVGFSFYSLFTRISPGFLRFVLLHANAPSCHLHTLCLLSQSIRTHGIHSIFPLPEMNSRSADKVLPLQPLTLQYLSKSTDYFMSLNITLLAVQVVPTPCSMRKSAMHQRVLVDDKKLICGCLQLKVLCKRSNQNLIYCTCVQCIISVL